MLIALLTEKFFDLILRWTDARIAVLIVFWSFDIMEASAFFLTSKLTAWTKNFVVTFFRQHTMGCDGF